MDPKAVKQNQRRVLDAPRPLYSDVEVPLGKKERLEAEKPPARPAEPRKPDLSVFVRLDEATSAKLDTITASLSDLEPNRAATIRHLIRIYKEPV